MSAHLSGHYPWAIRHFIDTQGFDYAVQWLMDHRLSPTREAACAFVNWCHQSSHYHIRETYVPLH